MELNKIYLGDAYELIKQMPDKSVDLIVTDPLISLRTWNKRLKTQQEYSKVGVLIM